MYEADLWEWLAFQKFPEPSTFTLALGVRHSAKSFENTRIRKQPHAKSFGSDLLFSWSL